MSLATNAKRLARRAPTDAELLKLLRSSHLFAAGVREVLEERVLREVCPAQMASTHFHLLKLVALDGNPLLAEMANFLGVSQPAVSKAIDRLESLGLVKRSSAKHDRRVMVLTVTAKGRKLVERYEQHKAKLLAPVLEGFDASELATLSGLLQRFTVGLYRAQPPEEGLCLRCAAYVDEHCPVDDIHHACPYRESGKSKSA